MTDEQADILALYGVPGVGAKTFARLVTRFGSAGAAFAAPDHELREVKGIGDKLLLSIREFDRSAFIRTQSRLMEQCGATVVTRRDPDYPPLLNRFVSAPPVLFVRGDPQTLHMPALAFVGTRKPTSWGVSITERLAAGAVRAGCCVVSGMAAGIDTAAHQAALDEGGRTAAVFGCGVDIIYPVENRKLAESIAASGCLVSHFPMGTIGAPGNFPARNAVVVGLSEGVVVTEAPKRSGALITADLALRAKRPLFAVPGNADSPASEGTNDLIAKGACPVSRIEQVLSRLGQPVPVFVPEKKEPGPPKAERPPLPGMSGDIMIALDRGPLQIEAICARLGEPVYKVLSELTNLEMDGYIRQKPGKVFEKMC
ncbi:MAG: DNA-processing protein DprA [Candidatus Latescibacterota bacterium]